MATLRHNASDIDDAIDSVNTLSATISQMILKIYPVGAVYISVSSTSPASLFGGTWEQIKDTFLLACGSTYGEGATGGEASHTLTTNEMPAHRHYGLFQYSSGTETAAQWRLYWSTGSWKQVTVAEGVPGMAKIHLCESAGGGTAHNNMPPYLAVYVWKRVA